MRRSFLAVFALLSAGVLCAQDTPKLEVRGELLEIGLGSGISGAQITVYQFSIDSERSVLAKGITDSQGHFEFQPDHPGRYYVEASKPEYFADSGEASAQDLVAAIAAGRQVEGARTTGSLVVSSKEHPREFVRLGLMRPAEVRGRVLDDKDKPLGSFFVEALEPGVPGVKAAAPLVGRASAHTRVDGSFTIGGLRPGQYVVRVSPTTTLALTPPTTKFSEEDENTVDEGLATAYWPGSRDVAGAGTVTLIPGTPMDLGAIHVSRTQLYRVRVSLRGCEPGDSVSYTLVGGATGIPGGIPLSLPGCDDFLIRGLPPGSYEVALQTKQKWALVPLDIVNRNVSLSITLGPEGQVAGEIVAAREGMSLDSAMRLSVTVMSAEPLVFMAHMMVSSPVAAGKFSLRAVRGGRHTVSVTGLGTQYYVKEIRVDGVASSDSTVTLGLLSRLEIVIDDQPAALTGVVMEGDEKVAQPRIYVVRWPPSGGPGSATPGTSAVVGDADGGFQMAGLAPGQYRVLALPPGPIPDGASEWKFAPQAWDRAETVTLERGKSSEVRLQMVDPMR